MDYDVPEQDLDVEMTDMPTLPESGFIIRRVRRTSERTSV
jgi:fatty-acid peroxygenase